MSACANRYRRNAAAVIARFKAGDPLTPEVVRSIWMVRFKRTMPPQNWWPKCGSMSPQSPVVAMSGGRLGFNCSLQSDTLSVL